MMRTCSTFDIFGDFDSDYEKEKSARRDVHFTAKIFVLQVWHIKEHYAIKIIDSFHAITVLSFVSEYQYLIQFHTYNSERQSDIHEKKIENWEIEYWKKLSTS